MWYLDPSKYKEITFFPVATLSFSSDANSLYPQEVINLGIGVEIGFRYAPDWQTFYNIGTLILLSEEGYDNKWVTMSRFMNLPVLPLVPHAMFNYKIVISWNIGRQILTRIGLMQVSALFSNGGEYG